MIQEANKVQPQAKKTNLKETNRSPKSKISNPDAGGRPTGPISDN